MVYIKLEENMDKFMIYYQNCPKTLQHIFYKAKCRKGKFYIEKIDGIENIVLPTINKAILGNLGKLAKIRCWKNICISDNLNLNNEIKKFACDNNLSIMDGKWLFKNIVDCIIEFLVCFKNENIVNQEVAFLCNVLDETIAEKIKEVSEKVKVLNILTNNIKQFKKLEDQIYEEKGIIVNVSNNYKQTVIKSNIIINFDFSAQMIEKCNLAKNVFLVNLNDNMKVNVRGKNIISYEIQMPKIYEEYKNKLQGFSNKVLYESFIYKHTNYNNIKKEILQDNVKINYLVDSDKKILKNTYVNFSKTLDKISI